jgi:hypothetical protein
VLECRVEATKAALATEGHNVGTLAILEVPVLMGPVLARGTHTSLGLVDDEWDALISCQVSQHLVEVWGSHLIIDAANWLNDHGSNSLSLGSLVGDDALDQAKASILLSSILMLVVGQWVLQLWVLSLWPWESWKILCVSLSGAAGKASSGLSMVAIIEAKNAKASDLSVMSLGIMPESDSEGKLVGLSACVATTKMNLDHVSWSHGHNHLSNKVSEVAWRE